MSHRAPWTKQDERTLYRCISAGMMQEQIAERLGRTKRAIRWKVGLDRASAAATSRATMGVEGARIPLTSNQGTGTTDNHRSILDAFRPNRLSAAPVAAAVDSMT